MDFTPIIPFEPIRADLLPKGDKWIAQVKWDGVRMLTYYDGHEVRLMNRRLHDRTLQYPELWEVKAYCSASSVILDGEIIAFDSNRPSFHEVMKRDSVRKQHSISLAMKQTPVTYMIFDVLFVNGHSVTDKTLAERQTILEQIIEPQPNVQFVQNFEDADGLFEVMKQHQMEGIVCKDLTSTYVISGKDKRWQKKKIFRDLFAVIGGVTLRNGIVNALLLGLYNDRGELIYIGHSGAGKLSNQDWRDLTRKIEPLIIKSKPFINEPERSKDAIWIKPELVVKVQFLEWTRGFTMRHPSIQAIVDRSIADCTVTGNVE
ncbi:RNA ligase family protein [Brevibacillus sp. H7]|jgi:bifunctional non-homologous end joining protein LigD|uniref:ATP-dependent DNA ligase n=1 Tax=Brevibacillus sp. H7 TaxID=3349138 RepID=UPI00381C9325